MIKRFTYQILWGDQYAMLWPLNSYPRKMLIWYVAKASPYSLAVFSKVTTQGNILYQWLGGLTDSDCNPCRICNKKKPLITVQHATNSTKMKVQRGTKAKDLVVFSSLKKKIMEYKTTSYATFYLKRHFSRKKRRNLQLHFQMTENSLIANCRLFLRLYWMVSQG